MLHKIKIAQRMSAVMVLLLLVLTPHAYGMKPQLRIVKIEPRSPQEAIDISFVQAAQNGHCMRVEELLPLVDVNVRVGDGNGCALGQAILHGHESVLRLLFKQRGLDLDSPINAGGMTPLAGATITENLDIVKMLAFARADINAVDKHGMHPLLLASEAGYVDIVKFFLQHVTNRVVALKTKDIGASALYMASQNGHDRVVELLVEDLDEEDIDARCDREGASPLWIASQKGHDKTVQLLAKAKANVNLSRKKVGSTPLWIASANGHLKTVQFLLGAKAEINRADSRGFFPIHAAAQAGHLSILEALLKDVEPEMVDIISLDGVTPLHVASDHNKLNAVALLLANKADPTITCFAGKHALDYASDVRVRELLERELAHEAAREATREEVVKYGPMLEHVIEIGNGAGPEEDGGENGAVKNSEEERKEKDGPECAV